MAYTEVARFDVRNSDGTLDTRYVVERDVETGENLVKTYVGEQAEKIGHYRSARQFWNDAEALSFAIAQTGWGHILDDEWFNRVVF